jgi:S1-C subfamily serine protease
VVRINTHITPDGRTVQGLGREREGSGILIDADGLVLTIGYLMVEAYAAEVVDNNGRAVPANVVGYDHETGFGLLRTIEPLKLKPMPLGKSAEIREGDPVLIASFGGPATVGGAYVVAKREFAGSWEYLLDEALFTAPPHPAWSGAALINREGKLVGVGSLIVGDAARGSEKVPGNMFVPIDRLAPILGDLITAGRTAGAGAAVAWAQHRGTARTAIRQPRDAERSGREGRHQERRCHRRGQWRATEELGRFLSQGLGSRGGGRHGGA